ncbi:biopolymer transporter ExbD [Bartonella birtlesii]|uniref:TonB system transporter ExbD n=1 Tax=Bartonella birtlesii LL-WM9 TaxID=1094552 RepID=J0YPG2_9HYPH|nr:biopolymer transporter ExbD [Bartonella birtlesii]EJF76598.1 TonB system transporter ExbD [Bartonella birtlesii LL-WM9]
MKVGFNDDFDSSESGLHSEINVTPFIDVVLVLLIVFMVAAPLATSAIPVQLPSITQAPLTPQPDEPLYVTLQKDHALYVGDHLVNQTTFVESLLKQTNQNRETRILIKADSEIDYGAVVDLLNQIRTAGYSKVGLMGLQKSSNVAARSAVSPKIGGEDSGKNMIGAGAIASDVVNTKSTVVGPVAPVE